MNGRLVGKNDFNESPQTEHLTMSYFKRLQRRREGKKAIPHVVKARC